LKKNLRQTILSMNRERKKISLRKRRKRRKEERGKPKR